MRNALRIIIILLSITIAGCSEKGNIESAIKDIYGSNVSPKEEDTSMIYVLDYSSKRESQEKDAIGLKDKIDKTTNSLAEKVGTDMASKSDTNTSATSQDDCLSDFYK